jgi:hypothetical protein
VVERFAAGRAVVVDLQEGSEHSPLAAVRAASAPTAQHRG